MWGRWAQEVDFCRYWDALDTGAAVKWAVRWESKAAMDVLVASAATVLTAGAELADNPWRQVRARLSPFPSSALSRCRAVAHIGRWITIAMASESDELQMRCDGINKKTG